MHKLKTLKNLCTFAFLICVVVACKQLASSDHSTNFKSADGKFQITAPEGWTARSPLGEDEIIRIWDVRNATMIAIATQRKSGLAKDITLDKYSNTARSQVLAKGIATDITTPESLTLDGNGARRYEMKVTVDNDKQRCLVTMVETPENFYRIHGCTSIARYDENLAMLKQVSDSFRAVPASDSK